MNGQERKYHLSLAGEFYVAAELQRRGVSAAVTYGNAKKADVLAFSASEEKTVVVEVKSTSGLKWIVGSDVPVSSSRPWVFVYVPDKPTDSPAYYVVLQSELHAIVAADEAEYRRRYRENPKNGGKEFVGRAVWNFTSEQATPYKDRWDKILGQLREGAGGPAPGGGGV